jgi:hypothetical protein
MTFREIDRSKLTEENILTLVAVAEQASAFVSGDDAALGDLHEKLEELPVEVWA